MHTIDMEKLKRFSSSSVSPQLLYRVRVRRHEPRRGGGLSEEEASEARVFDSDTICCEQESSFGGGIVDRSEGVGGRLLFAASELPTPVVLDNLAELESSAKVCLDFGAMIVPPLHVLLSRDCFDIAKEREVT